MPSLNVGLDVRNFPSNGTDGYINTTASNSAIYSYQYSGGSDGHGNADDTVGEGALTITVTVGTDPRYTINGVTFTGDIENQLSSAPGATPTSVIITDSDSQSGDGYYSVSVADNTTVCTFPCDPDIRNKPRPPK